MLDIFKHARLPMLARIGAVSVLAAFTFTAFAQYRQSGNLIEDLTMQDLLLEPVVIQEEESEFIVEVPDFTIYEQVDERKQAFFSFMIDFVETENARLAGLREELMPMWGVLNHGQPLTDIEEERLYEIAKGFGFKYDIEAMIAAQQIATRQVAAQQVAGEQIETTDPEAGLDADVSEDADLLAKVSEEARRILDAGEVLSHYEMVKELMRRVDVIPTSLVLAQAANESGWGTSRFAREGNNIFGQWCFDEGCGLVPNARGEDASHEVRAFASVDAAVRAYFRNLNTHPSYEDLRTLRASMRMQGLPLNSMVLARGLTRYSERGMDYVKELQDMIRINDLRERDRTFFNNAS